MKRAARVLENGRGFYTKNVIALLNVEFSVDGAGQNC